MPPDHPLYDSPLSIICSSGNIGLNALRRLDSGGQPVHEGFTTIMVSQNELSRLQNLFLIFRC